MKDFESPFPAVGRDRKKQLAAKILLRSLLYAFALFGLLFIVLLFVILGMLRQDTAVTAEVPDKAVLVVDFDEAFPEIRADDLFSELSEKPSLSFYDLLKAVNVAALDNRVKLWWERSAFLVSGWRRFRNCARRLPLSEKAENRRICIRLVSDLSATEQANIIWRRLLTRLSCSPVPKPVLPELE